MWRMVSHCDCEWACRECRLHVSWCPPLKMQFVGLRVINKHSAARLSGRRSRAALSFAAFIKQGFFRPAQCRGDGDVGPNGPAFQRASQAQVSEEICPFRRDSVPVFTGKGAGLVRRQAKLASDTAALAEDAMVAAAHGKRIRVAEHGEVCGRYRVGVRTGTDQGEGRRCSGGRGNGAGSYQGLHKLSFLAIGLEASRVRGARLLRNVDDTRMAQRRPARMRWRSYRSASFLKFKYRYRDVCPGLVSRGRNRRHGPAQSPAPGS